jgi:hypothetical protein
MAIGVHLSDITKPAAACGAPDLDLQRPPWEVSLRPVEALDPQRFHAISIGA